jgi:hypothetical protein
MIDTDDKSYNISTELIKKNIDDKIYIVHQTNNPDKYYEIFWLTFKNFAIKYMNTKSINFLILLSSQLDELQQEKKYDEIKDLISLYIKQNINNICKNILLKKCKSGMTNTLTKIKKWNYIDNTILDFCNNTINCSQIILLGRLIYRNNKHVNNLIDMFYDLELEKIKNYKTIFLYGIDNNIVSLIDLLYIYLSDNDISEICKITWDGSIYNNITGRKIIRIIKNKKKI